MQDLIERGKKNRIHAFNKSSSFVFESNYGSESLQDDITLAVQRIKRWEELANDHARAIEISNSLLNTGQVSEAANAIQQIGKVRFEHLSYQVIDNLESIQSSLAKLKAGAGNTKRLRLELKERYPAATDQSELMMELEAIAKEEKRKTRVISCGFIIFIMFGLVILWWGGKVEREAAQAKAEEARVIALAQAEIEAEEAKARAAEAKLRAERDAAEARAKTDREAEEAKAKAKLATEISAGRVGVTLGVPLAGNLVMPFAFCPAGSFTMGSPSVEVGRSSDENQVSVILSKAFWMAKTELTQAQWRAVMGSDPSHLKGNDLPVENVSWDDAQEFIKKVNDSGVIPEGWKVALPTEAQWEYACRAGETGAYSGGTIDQVAWYDDNSGSKTHAVGTKKSNAWGLHDMHGNVWEWCADSYGDELVGGSDPSGPSSGVTRVDRGGSWNRDAAGCRAAFRVRGTPDYRFSHLGFRPALVPSE